MYCIKGLLSFVNKWFWCKEWKFFSGFCSFVVLVRRLSSWIVRFLTQAPNFAGLQAFTYLSILDIVPTPISSFRLVSSKWYFQPRDCPPPPPPPHEVLLLALSYLLLYVLFKKDRYECFKLGLQLLELCFNHLFYTNNLLGNITWKKIFRSPPFAPSRLSFCAGVQVSSDCNVKLYLDTGNHQ